MRVLVVKLTSMGDAIHVLPALSDLVSQQPGTQVDWMIEKSFAEIPTWHTSVDRVIPVSTRQWRKPNAQSLREFRHFLSTLRERSYDVIIDAQGLMKSAVFSRFARLSANGVRVGFSADSIKERPAARLYHSKVDVPREQHAIDRLRALFAAAFNYEYRELPLDYGLSNERENINKDQLIFLHGTTWPSKHLPESHWQKLINLAAASGHNVLLPWGNESEKLRAERLASSSEIVEVLPRCSLNKLKQYLANSAGVIAVDTGLGHLAAGLGVPCVSVYGSTNAKLTGAVGESQYHIQADFECSPCLLKSCNKIPTNDDPPPCYATTPAEQIWRQLQHQMA